MDFNESFTLIKSDDRKNIRINIFNNGFKNGPLGPNNVGNK